jgi:3-mercaptopyruvate sulfurtransferase SseA
MRNATLAMTTTDVRVATDWLQAHVNDPSFAIEVSENTTTFASGPIPGAIGIGCSTDLRDDLRRDIVSAEGLARTLLGSNGLSDSHPIGEGRLAQSDSA